ISALAEAGAVLERDDLVEAAADCASFIWEEMRGPQGALFRSWRQGRATLNGYLEDYAFLVEALLELYQASLEPIWFERARALAESMIDRFADPDRGGFFTTSHDHEDLIARRKDVGDHPIPSGNASAALGLLKLYALSGERKYLRYAEGVLKLLAPASARQPDAFGHLLQALALYHAGPTELAVVVPRREADDRPVREADVAALLGVARESYRPGLVLAGGPAGSESPELLAGRDAIGDRPTGYLCRQFACQAPVTDPSDLRIQLDSP
ncbi:MAG: AGE family epimerase/isomerase, partial [Dehalococcoidia bacterium]|nr:AGE family epimerase/isomerase [Dehalococcoidia bacterium]